MFDDVNILNCLPNYILLFYIDWCIIVHDLLIYKQLNMYTGVF